MMINVSRFTQIQNDLSEMVADYVDEIRDVIEVYGLSPSADKNPTIRGLKNIFENSFPTCEFPWEVILSSLYQSNKAVNVFVVNTSKLSKQNKLDYDGNRHGLRAIVIGGQAIARGVTLEGLCVSYLYRSTAYYDTLMQMGRWFGYRPGYEDLCRIWLGRDTTNYYRQIARATTELKTEVAYMKEAGLTPEDFGLKVRESPDALLITSRNKMRTGKSIVLKTSFSSYFVESAQLKCVSNESNIQVVRDLVKKIKALGLAEQEALFKKRRIFRNVPREFVADFVEQFEVHPRCYQLSHCDGNEHGMANFIRNNSNSKLQTWDIVFDQRSSGLREEKDLIDLGLSSPLKCIRRCVSDLEAWKKGNLFFDKNRIAGSDVEAASLPEEIFNKIKDAEANRGGNNSDGLRLQFRNVRQRPMLVIMPVQVFKQTERKEDRFKEDSQLDNSKYVAYALSFCNFADNIRRNNDKVSYKVNKTWFREHLEYELESEEDE